MTLPGWLLCWKLKGWRLVRKHKRGMKMERPFSERELGISSYRCPRCHATWTSKARKAKP